MSKSKVIIAEKIEEIFQVILPHCAIVPDNKKMFKKLAKGKSPGDINVFFIKCITKGKTINECTICERWELAKKLMKIHDELDERLIPFLVSDLHEKKDSLDRLAFRAKNDKAQSLMLEVQANACGSLAKILVVSAEELIAQDSFVNRTILSLKELEEVIDENPDLCEIKLLVEES